MRVHAGAGMSDTLSSAERLRYSRHLLIPAVGEAGQLRLKNAAVLLIGTGALGSPAALYLAAGRSTLAEEMPEAYKDVNDVIRVVSAAGLAAKVARLKPLGVIKG